MLLVRVHPDVFFVCLDTPSTTANSLLASKERAEKLTYIHTPTVSVKRASVLATAVCCFSFEFPYFREKVVREENYA